MSASQPVSGNNVALNNDIPTGIHLRRATVSDALELAQLCVDSRRAAGDAFPPSVHRDDEFLPHLLRDIFPSSEVWLAESEQGTVVGVLVLQGDSMINDLYVALAAQGMGVGAMLLGHAKTVRPRGLELWVFVSNAPARRFYHKHGFVPIGGTSGDNEEGAPDLLLRWAPEGDVRAHD